MKFSNYYYFWFFKVEFIHFRFWKVSWNLSIDFVPLVGSAALQFTPVHSITDLVNSEVRDLIHSKGYFKGSSHSLDHVLSNVIHREIALSALGGLIGHLDRLMVHFYIIQW